MIPVSPARCFLDVILSVETDFRGPVNPKFNHHLKTAKKGQNSTFSLEIDAERACTLVGARATGAGVGLASRTSQREPLLAREHRRALPNSTKTHQK